MLLYIDPGTGGAFFSNLPALLAALGSGLVVVCGCILRPVRRFFARTWRLVSGKGRTEPPAGP